MKKRLLVMAMAGVALAGCVSDEVAEVAQKNEPVKIAFESPVLYDNAESRANVFGEYDAFDYPAGDGENFPGIYSYPRDENFNVFSCLYSGEFSSWTNGTNYWNNKTSLTVIYDEDINGWTSEEPYFWPSNNQKLAFAAYSPADLGDDNASVVPTYGASGLTVTNFKVSETPSEQFELLYSERSLNNTANQAGSSGFYNGAKLKFKHALSSIHFALKKDANVETPIYLLNVVMKNVKNKGTFNETLNETTNVASPVWSDQSGDIDYTIYNVGTAKGIPFPGLIPQHIHELSESVTGDTSNSLLVIPQSLPVTDGDNDNDIVIEVKYQIGEERAADNSNVKTVSVTVGNRTGIDIANNNNTITVNSWLPGKKYTYVLHYSAHSEANDRIYFAPEVSAWERVNQIYIDLY